MSINHLFVNYCRWFVSLPFCLDLLDSCQKPPGGHSALMQQLRYTAPLVQIEEFEGQP
ncbi:hypothetical protein [Pseudomonas sp. R37(2017)]|uniref:hypothetical protein n=1 Tax=Pseudomonas sp. R37(2017) TaxID=1981685 RepID=UPI001302193F|nr:hypothetical protein [Pseudomonas sp. R37(2017)]